MLARRNGFSPRGRVGPAPECRAHVLPRHGSGFEVNIGGCDEPAFAGNISCDVRGNPEMPSGKVPTTRVVAELLSKYVQGFTCLFRLIYNFLFGKQAECVDFSA